MVKTDTVTIMLTNIDGTGGTVTIIDTITIATMIVIDACRFRKSSSLRKMTRGGIAAYDAIVDPATSERG